MVKLDGTTVLVVGGAGEVGEGITRQFLRTGATVIVPSRGKEKLNALRNLLKDEDTSKLVTIVGSVGEPEGALAIRDQIQQTVGEIDHIVVSLGGWWQGKRLIDIDIALWHQLIDNSLTAHFITAKTFLPLIANRPGASYTLINGAGGLHPVPHAGPISVSAAGQTMLQRVLSAEMKSAPVRINSLILATPVKTRSRGAHVQPNWVSADAAGEYCVYLASESASGVKGETIIFDSPNDIPQ